MSTELTPLKNKIDELFPPVDCPLKPFDDRVTVQLQSPYEKIGSIIIPDPDGAKFAQQTARVCEIGEGPFKIEPKYKVGDFVRVPLYGGDKIEVPIEKGKSKTAIFVTFRAHEIIAAIQCDPLIIKTVV